METFDTRQLDRELDIVKSHVFLGNNAAFFGPLMCSLDFFWDEGVKTAGTDGTRLWWAPSYFKSLPLESRKTDLLHELGHVAFLHGPRRGNRDPKLWNIACDIKLDLMLEAEGCTFDKIPTVLKWYPPSRQYVGWVEEDIYDDLVKHAVQVPVTYQPDLVENQKNSPLQQANLVVQAMQQAKLAGKPGSIPGNLEETITRFLTPVVPWEQLIRNWMTDLLHTRYTLQRPNRRLRAATGLYMPARIRDVGRLRHVTCYEDVSGSITNENLVRFNSEVKYLKDTYQPKKMTLVQFDCVIQREDVIEEHDVFDHVKITGRGGTSLIPVREHIIQHHPTAVVIFSDLECEPMAPLPFSIPVLWVCVRNPTAKVPFGDIIHIRG